MLDFDKEFKDFYKKIDLNSATKQNLINSRNALRKSIKSYFKNNKQETQPKFYMQGSFHMKTTIKPLNDKEYDLDDGVYLKNIDTSEEIDKWVSPETVHKWIATAVEDHTSVPITDKNLCVRVNFKDGEKHVDLPIYVEKDGKYYLAIKNKGWFESNPKGIQDWFIEVLKEKTEQFRRVVKYLKAWKDSKNASFGGFQLTVLVGNHFYQDESDEESFYKTVKEIYNNLKDYKAKLISPIDNNTNIIEHYSDIRKEKFQKEFNELYLLSQEAYKEKDCFAKIEKWQEVFGDRFPILSNKDCEKRIGIFQPQKPYAEW